MTAHPPTGRWAYWLGRMTRRAWRGYVRMERRLFGWLAAKSWPVGGARALLWIVKLGALAILLYAAFWVAFVLALAVMCLWMIANADLEQDDPQPKWRDGFDGYGLYRGNARIDAGDPYEDE